MINGHEPTQGSHSVSPITIRPSLASSSQAVCILVHGLNLLPQKMDSVGEILQHGGCEVYRLALTGHRGDFEKYKNVTREQWLADLALAIHLAEQRARDLNVPVVFVGYSLGGLLGVDVLGQDPLVHFDRMILLSPALATQFPRWLIRPMLALFKNFSFKSAVPDGYRANDLSAVATYLALSESLEALQNIPTAKIDIPTLIIMDTRDELVSQEQIHKWILQRNLSKWQEREIHIEPDPPREEIHHLIIDEASVGTKTWNEITQVIQTFLHN